jgi:oxygen-dependent protoporphyrinogen oxidase
MNPDVVVVGAGVSGLATAHDLASRGLDVRVLERQAGFGGNVISERFDGFLMEHGPSTFNVTAPGAPERLRALGLEETACPLGPGVKKRYLRDGDALEGISVSPLGFFLSGYLSPAARLSMMAEYFRPRRTGGAEETIHEFAARRFGVQFAERVIDPLAAGLFMGDARALSLQSTFPKLAGMEREFGSITRAILAARRGSEPGRRLVSWAGGMAAVPGALAGPLKGRIETGCAVLKISATPAGIEIATASSGTLRARAMVLAVQPHVAAGLLERIEPEAAQVAGDIAAPGIGVVFLGYCRDQVEHALDGLGFLSTRREGRVISGAQFCSTMFEGRAPADHVAISCYTGGARNPDLARLPDRELAGQVQDELAGLLGIKGAPVVVRTRRWARGLPQYTVGHQTRRDVLASTGERLPGLFVTGNFMDGVSVSNCLHSASRTALAVAGHLGGREAANVEFAQGGAHVRF